MKFIYFFTLVFSLTGNQFCAANYNIASDTIKTSKGELIIYFVGHGTLFFKFNNLIIHVDPVSRYADYSTLPKADLILVTHHHGDHLDTATIGKISGLETQLYLTKICSENSGGIGNILQNGDTAQFKSIKIEAIPAYNLVHARDNGQPFHPKGDCNGYVLTFGDKRVYIAGDTENIPEMANLKDIYVAFLPMNLPYTMTPEMVVNAVEMIKPRILYPYHYGNTDTEELLDFMANNKSCEIRVRQMQ